MIKIFLQNGLLNIIVPLGADYNGAFSTSGLNSEPCWLGWNFSPACNTKLYQNKARDYMKKFSTQGWVPPRGWNFSPASGSRIQISALGLSLVFYSQSASSFVLAYFRYPCSRFNLVLFGHPYAVLSLVQSNRRVWLDDYIQFTIDCKGL